MGKLSIVIPTYNEKDNMEPLVERIFKALSGRDFDLLIVDDGSPDGTGEVADRLAATRPNMKVMHRAGKMGRGTGFTDGLRATDGEIVCIMDADLQHPPELLPSMLDKVIAGADLVVASRNVEGGGAAERGAMRGATSKAATWLSHLFLPQTRHIKDTQSGFFLFKRRGLDNVELEVKGFTVLVEVLAKGHFENPMEVPYTFQLRAGGDSKLGHTEILGYAMQLLRLSHYRFLKFVAVGATGVFVNNGVLFFTVSSGFLHVQGASLVAIEASILSNFALNNLWTFRHRKGEAFHFKLAKYHASVALGAAVNYITLTVLLASGLQLLVANTVGILLGFFLNYLLSEKYVWKLP